jgi:hypothetical protein
MELDGLFGIYPHPISYKMLGQSMLGFMHLFRVYLIACSGDMNYLIGE